MSEGGGAAGPRLYLRPRVGKTGLVFSFWTVGKLYPISPEGRVVDEDGDSRPSARALVQEYPDKFSIVWVYPNGTEVEEI